MIDKEAAYQVHPHGERHFADMVEAVSSRTWDSSTYQGRGSWLLREDREDDDTLGAASPVNPAAVRGPSGIWNEESLPVTEWEAAEHRVVLPQSLQKALGTD